MRLFLRCAIGWFSLVGGMLLLARCGVSDTGGTNPLPSTAISAATTELRTTTPAAHSAVLDSTTSLPVPDASSYPPPPAPTDAPVATSDTFVPIDPAILATQVAIIRQRVPLSQDDAVELAIAWAHYYGLQQQKPDNFVVKQMPLSQWRRLTGSDPRPPNAGSPLPGDEPNEPVWVVAMTGRVVFSGPGYGDNRYDNITVILSLATGEFKGSAEVGPGRPMPIPVP